MISSVYNSYMGLEAICSGLQIQDTVMLGAKMRCQVALPFSVRREICLGHE